jgi:hypothetical protein
MREVLSIHIGTLPRALRRRGGGGESGGESGAHAR